eukprot:COSAG01_NODE_88_length_27337_cov_22.941699_36_plen_194_part_00
MARKGLVAATGGRLIGSKSNCEQAQRRYSVRNAIKDVCSTRVDPPAPLAAPWYIADAPIMRRYTCALLSVAVDWALTGKGASQPSISPNAPRALPTAADHAPASHLPRSAESSPCVIGAFGLPLKVHWTVQSQPSQCLTKRCGRLGTMQQLLIPARSLTLFCMLPPCRSLGSDFAGPPCAPAPSCRWAPPPMA